MPEEAASSSQGDTPFSSETVVLLMQIRELTGLCVLQGVWFGFGFLVWFCLGFFVLIFPPFCFSVKKKSTDFGRMA